MNTITSNLRWRASGLLLFCRAKNLISFFFSLTIISSPSFSFSVAVQLFNAERATRQWSGFNGFGSFCRAFHGVVNVTQMALNHWHSTPIECLRWHFSCTISCDPRCWCLRLMCALRLSIFICLFNAHTRNEHDMPANARRQTTEEKKSEHRTTIFHARIVRIVRIGRQEPPEYDNRLMCSVRRWRERIKLEFVRKNMKKKKTNEDLLSFFVNSTIYISLRFIWWCMTGTARAYCIRWRTPHTVKRNVILSSAEKFCEILNEKNRSDEKTYVGPKKVFALRNLTDHRWAYQTFNMSTSWLIEAFFKKIKKTAVPRSNFKPRALEFHGNVPSAYISTSAKRFVRCQKIIKLIKTTKTTLLSTIIAMAGVDSPISNYSICFHFQ